MTFRIKSREGRGERVRVDGKMGCNESRVSPSAGGSHFSLGST